MSTPATAIDLDVRKFVLDVKGKRTRGLDARVDNSIVDGEIDRTTDGASTLSVTLHDPKRVLLRSGMFEYAIDTRLDSFFFRLVKVSKSDDDLTLVFEDREVALLRTRTSARTAPGPKKKQKIPTRASMTRAEFALSLVREVRPAIPFVCPQLHKRQPVAGSGDVREGRRRLPYQWRRGTIDGHPEDSWACLQRLAQEVNWRCFVSAGKLYFVSDDDLLKSPPKMTLSDESPGVVGIDFDIDNGKVRSEVTLTARASRWQAAPGEVVKLEGLGPANGLWLVHSARRGLYDPNATITLRRATKPLREPEAPLAAAKPTRTRRTTAGVGDEITAADVGGSAIETAYIAAQAIDAKKFPYVWGGGHGAAGIPSGSPSGFDCSGSTCAVLAAAGFGFHPGGPVQTSGGLMGWGVAGRGRYLTVYANAVHVFMVFHTKAGDQHFGTGRWGKSWGGAGFNPQMHPTSGFVARHWPGT